MIKKIGVIFTIAIMLVVPVISLIHSSETEANPAWDVSFKKGYYVSSLNSVETDIYNQLDIILGSEYGSSEPRDVLPISLSFSAGVFFEGDGAEEKAKDYAKGIVDKVLTVKYYSDVRSIWLWNYPIVDPVYDITIVDAVIDIDSETKYVKVPTACSFTLEVEDRFKGRIAESIDAVLKKCHELDKSVDPTTYIRNIYSELSSIEVIDDEDGKVSTVYDALVERKSSSIGISIAFKTMASINNISSIVVTGKYYGDSNEGKDHFWNYVEYDDRWYVLDATISGCLMLGYNDMLSGMPITSTLREGEVNGLYSLNPPNLNRDSYEFPDERSFLEKNGSNFIIIVIGVLLIACIVMAIRQGLA